MNSPAIAASEGVVLSHHGHPDRTTTAPKRVLAVVANPIVSTNNGWSVGFWASELTHSYDELTENGVDVTIASPDGGKVEFDSMADPRDGSGWSAGDLVSMGFIHTPRLMALLEDTPRLADLDLAAFDALLVCGGQSPVFTFPDHPVLQQVIRRFYESEKITAALCHGVSALVDVQLSDGSFLVAGKTVTGFANVEEDYSNAAFGVEVMPWRLEDALRTRGANYVQAGLFKPFAIRDDRLLTGQQQYSGRTVARHLVTMLGV
jgi:putative intracellular protease/amidase